MNEFTKSHLRKDIEFSYDEKGDIEILISPGYGAGWSTWNENYSINLAVDKKIIDYFKTHKYSSIHDLRSFMQSIGYDERVYYGGWNNIKIMTVPKNCKFRIEEYDGSESLITYANDELWEL